jgi:outer membrane protein TolC
MLAVGVPSALLANRPDVQAHLHTLEAAYLEKEAARAAFLPAFNIAGYLGWQSFKMPAFFDFRSIAFGLLGNISAPLLQRRQVRGQYVLSDAALQSALLQYQHTLRLAVGEVYNMVKAHENLSLQINQRIQELDTWRAAVSTANSLYVSGYATYLEIITAQQSLLEADLELVRLREQQWHAVIGLYRATGGGWRG